MALINIEGAVRRAVTAMKRAPEGAGIELLSYKRNRGISMVRMGEGRVLVRERGYLHQELELSLDELPKVLKGMVRREFPRSRKLRLYRLEGAEEMERQRKVL